MMGLSLVIMFGLSSSVHFKHFCTTHKSSVNTGFTEQIMLILRILCYNGSLVTWTVAILTTAKFKPLIFSVSGFALSYTADMFILMILYDLCLLPAQFCYIIVYIRKVKSYVQIADRCLAMDVLYCCTHYLAVGCLPRICLRGNVFIEPLPSTGSIRHNMFPLHCTYLEEIWHDGTSLPL
jgi:hypothetical protein